MIRRRRPTLAALAVAAALAAPTLGSASAASATAGAPPTITPQIVGGTPVPDGKFGFQVAIVQTGPGAVYDRFTCGGSLISSQWVLTAGHCVSAGAALVRTQDLHVVVGRTTLSSRSGRELTITRIARHPRYDSLTLANDVSLLKLSSPVSLPTILPAFASDDGLEAPGTRLTVTGWGNTKAQPVDGTGGWNYPDRLRQVTVPVVSDTQCAYQYRSHPAQVYIVAPVMVCAGAQGLDACQGDSGGPMFGWSTARRRYVEVGIVSSGAGCAAKGYAGVYTEVNATGIRSFIQATAGV